LLSVKNCASNFNVMNKYQIGVSGGGALSPGSTLSM
jgi:hypothetical protein